VIAAAISFAATVLGERELPRRVLRCAVEADRRGDQSKTKRGRDRQGRPFQPTMGEKSRHWIAPLSSMRIVTRER
jgi:hypothetical protein